MCMAQLKYLQDIPDIKGVRKKILFFIKKLREEFPTKLKIKVRFQDIEKSYLGYYKFIDSGKNKYNFIVIRKNLPYYVIIDTLAHEWSHLLSNEIKPDAITDHNTIWALFYGKIYRKLIDD